MAVFGERVVSGPELLADTAPMTLKRRSLCSPSAHERTRHTLVVLGTLGGAGAITTGIMLLVGVLHTADFADDAIVARADHRWWWYIIYLALAVFGAVAPLRSAERRLGSIRESWASRRRT
jgi:hypothetical protein